jgi:hypothetical protein
MQAAETRLGSHCAERSPELFTEHLRLLPRRSLSKSRSKGLTSHLFGKSSVWRGSLNLRRQRGSGLLGDHVFSVPIGPGFIVAAAVAFLMLAVCGSSPL